MRHTTDLDSDRRRLHTAVVVGALALAILVWPAAASAGHGRGDKHHDRGRHHGRGHGAVVQRYDHHRHGSSYRHHAEPRYEHHRERHYESYRGHHYVGHRRFVVPRAIHSHYVRTYQPYYYGRAFYAPHHHYHVIYRFPVYGYGEPVYYPYAYCGDELFARGVFTNAGPRFSFSLSIVR